MGTGMFSISFETKLKFLFSRKIMNPLPSRLSKSKSRYQENKLTTKDLDIWPVFPGTAGPLHTSHYREISLDSQLCRLLNDLSFDQVLALAYMFNFQEESGLLSNKGFVKFQLEDSDWSKSVSLQSVGVNQAIVIPHEIKGALEVGLKIRSAPGRLSQYTKIVRLTPRFIIVNRIDYTLKVCQMDSFQADNYNEIEVSSQHVRAYHLPSYAADRRVSFQVEGLWEKSVSFNIDQIGVFTLELKRRIDLASISHVNTRGNLMIPKLNCLY
jgi:hypothetical protein